MTPRNRHVSGGNVVVIVTGGICWVAVGVDEEEVKFFNGKV